MTRTCPCGKTISGNKALCLACLQKANIHTLEEAMTLANNLLLQRGEHAATPEDVRQLIVDAMKQVAA